jgi:hypothetical protein
MFINPADSLRLVESKQQDYRKAAEAHRLAQELKGQGKGSSTSVKVGLALIAIISVLAVASQFVIA